MHYLRRLQPTAYLRLLLRTALAGLLTALLGACATPPSPVDPVQLDPSSSQDSEGSSWWYVRFRLARNADDDVDSFLDPLIADQLLSPAIAQYASQLALWRFHRRWPEDDTGHQFSFIFLAPSAVAASVIAQIGRDPLLNRLQADGHLVEYRVDKTKVEPPSDPAATSDRSWSPVIQREWPKFIMGASRMWLGLVQTEAASHPGLEIYSRYRKVEEALDELWYNEGNHAFFHHLSALFGYRPLRVIRRDIMTF
jgi:hypothetical protein